MAWRRGRETSHGGAAAASAATAGTGDPSGSTASSNNTSSNPTSSYAAYTTNTIGEYLAPFSTAVSQGLSSAHSLAGAQAESTRLLADLAPHIMKPRILSAATNASHSVTSAVTSNALVGFLPIPLNIRGGPGFSLTQPARNVVRIGKAVRHGPITSNDLIALESSHQILADAALSMSAGYAEHEEKLALMSLRAAASANGASGSVANLNQVSLLRGFEATIPTALQGRERRRRERAQEGPRLGLKSMGDKARGLLTVDADLAADESIDSVVGPLSPSSTNGQKKKKEMRKSLRSKVRDIPLSEEDLTRQEGEVSKEKEDIDVRRRLLQDEMAAVDLKIASLQKVKDGLARSLTALKEEELELEDEQAGIVELISLQRHRRSMPGASSQSVAGSTKGGNRQLNDAGGHQLSTSRRRRGPLFLPGEHDELPSNVAFMTLAGHTAPITCLDFSEPYGALVTAGGEQDATTRVWDLSAGTEVGRLRHDAVVKALQVEDELCITGGADAKVKIWDLRKVEDWETKLEMKANGQWSATVVAEDGSTTNAQTVEEDGSVLETTLRQGGVAEEARQDIRDESDPKLKTLEGHSKAVTALYFDDTCLVTGANDKTLRQWDLNTGQCVLTMDILWAISNPTASQALGSSSPPSPDFSSMSSSRFSNSHHPSHSMGSPRRPGLHTGLSSSHISDWSGNFSFPTPPLSDGSWELYTDFVGSSAIQFWGYALASGSADGAVRMWDMRTGQSHRTLLGHTSPVTTLQFDEHHIISGSLDRSVRIWDLRTGTISETIKYDYPITDLQFDSRKIVAATGESGIKIFNRTTLQHSTLNINGHTKPAERLRYMDRYAVTGGKDSLVKVWAL